MIPRLLFPQVRGSAVVHDGKVTFPAPYVAPPETAAPKAAAEAVAVAPPSPFSLKLKESLTYTTG